MEPATPSTRDRIVEVATRLFAERGIRSTTTAAIEAEAGLRPGSGGLHRHFATKDDVVRAVLDKQVARARASVQVAIEDGGRVEPAELDQALRSVGVSLLHGTAEHREVALILLRDAHNLPVGALDDHLRANFEIVYSAVAARLAAQYPSLTEHGFTAEALAFLMVAPLLYHRIVEWAIGVTVLGLEDSKLVDAWARTFAILLRSMTDDTTPP